MKMDSQLFHQDFIITKHNQVTDIHPIKLRPLIIASIVLTKKDSSLIT